MMSLKLRLLFGAVVGLFGALIIAALVLVNVFEAHVRQRYVEELDEHIHQLTALVQTSDDGQLALRHELYNDTFQKPFSGLYWQIEIEGKRPLRSKSLWDFSLAPRERPPVRAARKVTDAEGPRGQGLLVVERVVLDAVAGATMQIVVAGDRIVVDSSRAQFASSVAYLLTSIGVLLGIGSWFQVSLGLAPLGHLHKLMDDLHSGRTSKIDGRFPAEISRLVDDLNRVMAAQTSEVERARDNAGKLGHGLKTPLAVVAADCRALNARGETDLAASIETQIEEMNAQIARAIASARAVGPRKALGATVHVARVVARMIDVMKRLPRGDRLIWTPQIVPGDLTIEMDHRDFEEILGNLLDNARKWSSSQVDVRMFRTAESLMLEIEDDGPGVPFDRRSEVLEGGYRLDRSIPGTGIGLAIANDIAKLHGGQLSLTESARGGVRVGVTFTAES